MSPALVAGGLSAVRLCLLLPSVSAANLKSFLNLEIGGGGQLPGEAILSRS
jgi:hypothetical protein